MKHELSPRRSIADCAAEEVRSWVADYIRMGRLSFSVNELLAESLTMEGTRAGVTKTKVRKARRSLLQKRGRLGPPGKQDRFGRVGFPPGAGKIDIEVMKDPPERPIPYAALSAANVASE